MSTTTNTENNEQVLNEQQEQQRSTIVKIERTVSTFSFVNGSINLVFDSDIERYVKVNDTGDPKKDFKLQQAHDLSKFEGEIVKALCQDKFFKYAYNLAKTMLSNGRKNDDANMISKGSMMRQKCLSYALSDCKITLTYKDVSKGTMESYIDPLDGQKKERQSQRDKRQYEISQVQLDDFGKTLIKQMLLD